MKAIMLFTSFVALLLTGCARVRPYVMPEDRNLISGAGAVLATPANGQIDVEGEIAALVNSMTVDGLKPGNDTLYQYRRNELQSRIIMASNHRCGLYLREIAAAKSQSNMGWGTLGLLFSGAASVIPHAQTAKAFAAASTISTGADALYEQAYFNNLAVNVIAAGITKQREGILMQMKELSTRGMLEYPVHRAVADALLYHSSCNVISGLEAAAIATKLAPTKPIMVNGELKSQPPQVPPILP